jgi:hypothetical protein
VNMGPASNPAQSGESSPLEKLRDQLTASREYDFRTPPASPRAPQLDNQLLAPPLQLARSGARSSEQPPNLQGDPQVVEDTALEPMSKHGGFYKEPAHPTQNGRNGENGMSRLIDVDNHGPKLREPADETDSTFSPRALRGAPALRPCVSDQLQQSDQDEVCTLHVVESRDLVSKVALADQMPSSDDIDYAQADPRDESTTDLAEQAETSPEDDDDASRYKL